VNGVVGPAAVVLLLVAAVGLLLVAATGGTRCGLFGHRWTHGGNPVRIEDVPSTAWFFRVDCDRCGKHIDAAPLRRLFDERPAFYAYLRQRGQLP
jgi:hypothetical protein